MTGQPENRVGEVTKPNQLRHSHSLAMIKCARLPPVKRHRHSISKTTRELQPVAASAGLKTKSGIVGDENGVIDRQLKYLSDQILEVQLSLMAKQKILLQVIRRQEKMIAEQEKVIDFLKQREKKENVEETWRKAVSRIPSMSLSKNDDNSTSAMFKPDPSHTIVIKNVNKEVFPAESLLEQTEETVQPHCRGQEFLSVNPASGLTSDDSDGSELSYSSLTTELNGQKAISPTELLHHPTILPAKGRPGRFSLPTSEDIGVIKEENEDDLVEESYYSDDDSFVTIDDDEDEDDIRSEEGDNNGRRCNDDHEDDDGEVSDASTIGANSGSSDSAIGSESFCVNPFFH